MHTSASARGILPGFWLRLPLLKAQLPWPWKQHAVYSAGTGHRYCWLPCESPWLGCTYSPGFPGPGAVPGTGEGALPTWPSGSERAVGRDRFATAAPRGIPWKCSGEDNLGARGRGSDSRHLLGSPAHLLQAPPCSGVPNLGRSLWAVTHFSTTRNAVCQGDLSAS